MSIHRRGTPLAKRKNGDEEAIATAQGVATQGSPKELNLRDKFLTLFKFHRRSTS